MTKTIILYTHVSLSSQCTKIAKISHNNAYSVNVIVEYTRVQPNVNSWIICNKERFCQEEIWKERMYLCYFYVYCSISGSNLIFSTIELKEGSLYSSNKWMRTNWMIEFNSGFIFYYLTWQCHILYRSPDQALVVEGGN